MLLLHRLGPWEGCGALGRLWALQPLAGRLLSDLPEAQGTSPSPLCRTTRAACTALSFQAGLEARPGVSKHPGLNLRSTQRLPEHHSPCPSHTGLRWPEQRAGSPWQHHSQALVTSAEAIWRTTCSLGAEAQTTGENCEGQVTPAEVYPPGPLLWGRGTQGSEEGTAATGGGVSAPSGLEKAASVPRAREVTAQYRCTHNQPEQPQ